MKLKRTLSLFIIVLSITSACSRVLAQTTDIGEQDNTKRCFIGSSLFLLGNFAEGDPPYYGQLNVGYHLTEKDVLSVEAITWRYYGALGSYQSEEYPGEVRAYGIGVAYQRFLWKNLYSSVHATPFLQQFFDEDDHKIQNGFQLYLHALLGYRVEFFNQRWFIEPAIGFKYWPINTNVPASFKEVERGEPDYAFEPSLHFGFRF